MNIELYSKKRDELSNLLDCVITDLNYIEGNYRDLKLSSLKNTKEKISKINQRVKEDIFKIVLVARFQGGKSTSFNAITGGAVYSPMGNGAIKCSASLVSAKNVVDVKKQGVTVYMRSLGDLADLVSVAGFDGVDLKSRGSVNDARELWQAKFDLWKQDSRVFKDDDERDMFFVAGIIFEFIHTQKIQNYLSKGAFDVTFAEIDKFAKFPENYIVRYSKNGGPSAFNVEEVIYAFVKKIEIRVKNTEISKIGARFVDAPGLFANEYDTRVTRAELSDASAVWYLLGGKQPGNEELKAIKECLELCKGRVFFSANMLGNLVARPTWIKEILPVIEQPICNLTNEQVTIQPYHALLALLYIQGKEYVEKGHWVDESVRTFLANECKKVAVPNVCEKSATDHWRILVKITVNKLYPFGLEEFNQLADPLSAEGLNIIRRESNWDGTIETIQNFVVKTKAKSILITDTAQEARNLIRMLESALQTLQNDANKSFEEANADYIAAENELKEFEIFMNQELEEHFMGLAGADIDTQLAANVHKEVFVGAISDIAAVAAPQIVDESGLFNILGSKIIEYGKQAGRWFSDTWNKIRGRRVEDKREPIENAIKVKIKDIMNNTCRKQIDSGMFRWMCNLKEGNNPLFRRLVIAPAKSTYQLLEREWKIKCSQNELLESFLSTCPPSIPETILSGRFDNPEILGFLAKMSFSDFVEDIVAAAFSVMFVLAMPEPFSMAIMAIIVTFIDIIRRLANYDEQVKKMERKIKEELNTNFNHNSEAFIENMAPKLAVLREAVVQVLRKPFDTNIAAFGKAKADALAIFNSSMKERERIAAECKEIREGFIDGQNGIKQRIEDYITETAPLC